MTQAGQQDTLLITNHPTEFPLLMDKMGGVVTLHSDATDLGIQKSVLKAPTSALLYSKTLIE